MLPRQSSFRHVGVGIFIPQFIERKRALGSDLDRSRDGTRQICKPFGDPATFVQVPLAIGEQLSPHFIHRAAMPHGGERVEERHSRTLVVADIAGGHERHPRPAAECGKQKQPLLVVALTGNFRETDQSLIKHIPPLQDGLDGVAGGSGRHAAGTSRTATHERRQRHSRQQALRVPGDVVE